MLRRWATNMNCLSSQISFYLIFLWAQNICHTVDWLQTKLRQIDTNCRSEHPCQHCIRPSHHRLRHPRVTEVFKLQAEQKRVGSFNLTKGDSQRKGQPRNQGSNTVKTCVACVCVAWVPTLSTAIHLGIWSIHLHPTALTFYEIWRMYPSSKSWSPHYQKFSQTCKAPFTYSPTSVLLARQNQTRPCCITPEN